MFVVCSDDYAGAGLVAQCDPAIVLQTPGGARATRECAARATFEYAVQYVGVRLVVVLAHRGCQAARGAALKGAPEEALAQWQMLTSDDFSRSLFLGHGVAVRLLWIDALAGTVCDWHAEEQRLAPLRRDDFADLLASLGATTS